MSLPNKIKFKNKRGVDITMKLKEYPRIQNIWNVVKATTRYPRLPAA